MNGINSTMKTMFSSHSCNHYYGINNSSVNNFCIALCLIGDRCFVAFRLSGYFAVLVALTVFFTFFVFFCIRREKF